MAGSSLVVRSLLSFAVRIAKTTLRALHRVRTGVVLAAVLLLVAAGCASPSTRARPTPSFDEVRSLLSPPVTVPQCPEHPTGVRLQVARFPGDSFSRLRASGLTPGQFVLVYMGCRYGRGTGSSIEDVPVGPDGVLIDDFPGFQDCTSPKGLAKCIAVISPVGMGMSEALACAEATMPVCWAKEAGMYCRHLGLCVGLGTLLFLLAVIAFLRPGTFKAEDRKGRKAIAIFGALAALIMTHCFDCANQNLQRYTAKSFNVWPHLLSSPLFELMVAAVLILLLRFVILCVKRSALVGWVLLLGGLALLLLLPVTLAVEPSFPVLRAWAMFNLVPDKMLPLSGAAVAVTGLVSILSPRGETAPDGCGGSLDRTTKILVVVLAVVLVAAGTTASAIAMLPPQPQMEEHLVSLDEAQSKVDFHILVPQYLPRSFRFRGVSVDEQPSPSVSLAYKGRWMLIGNKDLHVWEREIRPHEKCALPQYSPKPVSTEKITVRGHEGVFIRHKHLIFLILRPTELDWCEEDLQIVISGFEGKKTLLKMAESMK